MIFAMNHVSWWILFTTFVSDENSINEHTIVGCLFVFVFLVAFSLDNFVESIVIKELWLDYLFNFILLFFGLSGGSKVISKVFSKK